MMQGSIAFPMGTEWANGLIP